MRKQVYGVLLGCVLIFGFGGCDAKEGAKKSLEQKGITYSQESFAKAITSNNNEVVELFMKAGIDFSTPEILEAMIASDDMTIVNKALQNGFNPNVKSNGVPFIVMLARDKKNNPKLKDLLTAKDVNVDLQVEKKYKNYLETANALFECALTKNLEGFEMLIKKGASTKINYLVNIGVGNGDINANIVGILVLSGQAEEDAVAMLKLIPNLDPNSKLKWESGEEDEINLIHLASYMYKSKIISFLLDKGADINAQTSRLKNTPLHAIYSMNIYRSSQGFYDIDTNRAKEIEKLLLSRGANPKLKTQYGETYLMIKKAFDNPSPSEAVGVPNLG